MQYTNIWFVWPLNTTRCDLPNLQFALTEAVKYNFLWNKIGTDIRGKKHQTSWSCMFLCLVLPYTPLHSHVLFCDPLYSPVLPWAVLCCGPEISRDQETVQQVGFLSWIQPTLAKPSSFLAPHKAPKIYQEGWPLSEEIRVFALLLMHC